MSERFVDRPTPQDPPLQLILLHSSTDEMIGVWRMLVGCVLLNASGRDAVDLVWPELLTWYPAPWLLLDAYDQDPGGTVTRLEDAIRPTGLASVKAARLLALTHAWSTSGGSAILRAQVTHLPGCGPYAQESYDVFVAGREIDRPADAVIRRWVKLCRREGREPSSVWGLSLPEHLRDLPAHLVGAPFASR